MHWSGGFFEGNDFMDYTTATKTDFQLHVPLLTTQLYYYVMACFLRVEFSSGRTFSVHLLGQQQKWDTVVMPETITTKAIKFVVEETNGINAIGGLAEVRFFGCYTNQFQG